MAQATGVMLAAVVLFGMVVGASPLILAAIAGGVALAVASPFGSMAMLAVLLPLREPDVLQPLGVILPLIGATAAGCLARLPFEGRRLSVSAMTALIVVYLALSAVSVPIGLSGGAPHEQGTVVVRFTQTVAISLLFVTAMFLFRRTSPLPYLGLLIASATIAAGLGILITAWGGPAGIPLRGVLSAAPDAEWFDRVAGPFFNPNYFGYLLASAITLIAGLIPRIQRRWWPLVGTVTAILALALILAFSRGAILAGVGGVLAVTFWHHRRLAIGAGVAAIIAAVILYPVFLEARLERTFGDSSNRAFAAEQANVDSREQVLQTGVRIFLTEPLIGVGYGRFQFTSPRFQGNSEITFAHSVYLQILAEQGIVGTTSAALFGLALLLAVVRNRGPFAATGFGVFASYMVAGLFLELTISLQASALAVIALGAAITWTGRPIVGSPSLRTHAPRTTAQLSSPIGQGV